MGRRTGRRRCSPAVLHSWAANGTAYDAAHADGEYVHVDADGAPGYLTAVERMHRMYNPNSGEHFYTSDSDEAEGLAELGWNEEGFGWAKAKSEKQSAGGR